MSAPNIKSFLINEVGWLDGVFLKRGPKLEEGVNEDEFWKHVAPNLSSFEIITMLKSPYKTDYSRWFRGGKTGAEPNESDYGYRPSERRRYNPFYDAEVAKAIRKRVETTTTE